MFPPAQDDGRVERPSAPVGTTADGDRRTANVGEVRLRSPVDSGEGARAIERRGPDKPPSVGRLSGVLASIACLAVALVPLFFREAIVFKAGVVLIFFVAAIGMHVLVNWAGELSLAHSTMVGVSAFGVLAVSDIHHISPVYLLPLGVVIGALVGAVVALPVLRAQGVQVALVTLVAGIAIDRYFYTQPWLVGGSSGRAAATPTLGPLHLTTSHSLYVLLLAVVVGAVGAAWVMMHSKARRAWQWIQANPDAASAFGVLVVVYRVGAYALGGAFAGLAGGLDVMWIQRVDQNAFPAAASFNYLLVAVLGGGGFVGGLAAATWVLEGGQQFASNIFGVDAGKIVDALLAYGGPLGLISMITQYQAGFNGVGRDAIRRIRRGLLGRGGGGT